MSIDVTVKIITLPEDQLQENYEEGEESGGADREDELANAMSLLLDSLLVKYSLSLCV